MTKFSTVILAAGKGKRMQSDLPKVLHPVGGRPMISFLVELSHKIKSQKTVVVVGAVHDEVKAVLAARFPQKNALELAVQKEQRGTGHAVQCALESVKFNRDSLLVLNADMPLISQDTIQKFWRAHQKSKAVISILTADKIDMQGFGRVLRQAGGDVARIVEERDATASELAVRESNLAIYFFDLAFIKSEIGKLNCDNTQREYYLTDLVELAVQKKRKVFAHKVALGPDTLGVNSIRDLALVNQTYYEERREDLRERGVVLLGEDIFVDADATVAAGVRLESPCYLKGKTRVASGVVIESGCVVKDAHIGKGALIKSHCYIQESRVGQAVQVGPFAHLRPHTVLSEGVRIGNFVEIKKSTIGKGSKVNHLSYLGDAVVGKNVNVGAGTITCNYDGTNKFQTVLKDGVFIGSDTQLVAPVTVGKGAYVGAGTTLTKNVKPGSLAISRVPQREIPDWVARKKIKKSPA